MSNSDLISYRRISPNRNHPRNHVIDTITIHHMAGNLSVERCGEIFQNVNREASSNYGIGTDGRIALYVPEEDRAWTSGSPANDNRAITIEVANDTGEPYWHVSDTAINSLIALLVDICKRNGIKKLLWKNDKSLIGKVKEQNMTVHRWFQATACPGPYLMNKMGWIAEQVNKKLEDEEMLTYEQFKEYMARYEEERAAKPADEWAEPYVEWAEEHGVMVGDPDGNFRGQDPVKREELAVTSRAIVVAIADAVKEATK